MNKPSQKAAKLLLNSRQSEKKIARLSTEIAPTNCEQALQIQAQMINQRSDGIAAWKCLLPLSENKIVVAPIFSDTVQSGETCALFAENGKVHIEPEIAFVLGKDLPAREEGYSDAEIDNAVKSCHMALELMQDRFSSEVSFYEKLADCLLNQGLFIGPEIDKSKAYLASKFVINIDQHELLQTFSGKHPNLLPQKPLYWLINYMSKRGVDFTAGQAIITGSYAGIVEVEFNQATEFEYLGLGKYQLTFVPNNDLIL
ncbi:hydratase [Psychromonas hadalis]|uniref:hydratase n=1 Tax=Psychromonas hadalis TaxID=211669 RepID=UPI0003B3C52A|nr:hydratase [Psychromonas hadalis]